MSVNLLKRLESSVNSFQLTLQRIYSLINDTVDKINRFEQYGTSSIDMYESADTEWDIDDSNTEFFTVGNKVQIDLADMDYKTWQSELTSDIEVLNELMSIVECNNT